MKETLFVIFRVIKIGHKESKTKSNITTACYGRSWARRSDKGVRQH